MIPPTVRVARFAELDAAIAIEVKQPPRVKAEQPLRPIVRRPPAVEVVIADAIQRLGVTREELFSKRQFAPLVAARRKVAIDLRRKGYSLTRIARFLGGMHHTTVCHYLRDELPVKPYDPTRPDESGVWNI